MTPLEQLEGMIKLQISDGNWNYDEYMHGLANGMILAHHIIASKEGSPVFKTAPGQWLRDLKSTRKPVTVDGPSKEQNR